jgi:polysaccharide export outer membrane protein
MKIKLSAFAGLIGLLTACTTPKNILYFQGLDSLTPEEIARTEQHYTSRICPDDLLTITVTAWDPTVVTPFNPPVWAYTSQGGTVASAMQPYAYLVDTEGNINFPVLGKVHAAGLSKQELTNYLQEKISQYVKDALVDVQIINYRITVIGEINRPGALSVRNDRISILDAIGQLGDLTINANRTNILVIRDNDGVKEFGRIDLTDPSIFASPYYYLKQNDLVYIEPNKAKQKNSRYSQDEAFTMSIVSTCITAVNVIATIILAATRR